jgi:hypothetical protein
MSLDMTMNHEVLRSDNCRYITHFNAIKPSLVSNELVELITGNYFASGSAGRESAS